MSFSDFEDDIQLDYIVNSVVKNKNYIIATICSIVGFIFLFNVYSYYKLSEIKKDSFVFDKIIYSDDEFIVKDSLNNLSKSKSIYGDFARFIRAGYLKNSDEYLSINKKSNYDEIGYLSGFYSDYLFKKLLNFDYYNRDQMLLSLAVENISADLFLNNKFDELHKFLENYQYSEFLPSDERIKNISLLSNLLRNEE